MRKPQLGYKSLFSPWSVTVAFILALATWLRVADLGHVPAGLTWDEAAIGYVGKLVVTTGRDEWGQRLPRAFRSFGDYKAPVAFYLAGTSTALFGMNPWAVRLPFALSGVVAVALVMAITHELWRDRWYSALAGFFLAVTPWHIHYSRVAFESGLAMTSLLLFLWGWLRVREQSHWRNLFLLTTGGILTFLAYHSGRVVLPLSIFAIAIHEVARGATWWHRHLRALLVAALVGVVGIGPVVVSMVWGPGVTRAAQTSIFADGFSSSQAWNTLFAHWAAHFSPAFWVGNAATTARHMTGPSGVLLWTQAVLVLLGVSFVLSELLARLGAAQRAPAWLAALHHHLIRHPRQRTGVHPLLWLGLLIIGLFPGALGQEVPHSNRTLLALPAAIILMTYAAQMLYRDLPGLTRSLMIGGLLLFLSLELARWWWGYTILYRSQSAREWLDGYTQGVLAVQPAWQAGKRIKFTSDYGEPSMFWAFATNMPGVQYRQERVASVVFGPTQEADLERFDVVVTSDRVAFSIPASRVVRRADGSVALRIYER